jgi:LytS/YehU family sensor histidine kinase
VSFLRATLGASRAETQSLAAERAWIEDYLALMQIRLGARLTARWDIPTALEPVQVPALLLQPAVENAIRHGIEPKPEGGRIEISARREGGELLLRVRDTGVGLPAAAQDRFGLVQLRERLRLLHGSAASVALAAAGDAEGGALVTLRLPIALPVAPSAP